jgi:hypothetical protein
VLDKVVARHTSTVWVHETDVLDGSRVWINGRLFNDPPEERWFESWIVEAEAVAAVGEIDADVQVDPATAAHGSCRGC